MGVGAAVAVGLGPVGVGGGLEFGAAYSGDED